MKIMLRLIWIFLFAIVFIQSGCQRGDEKGVGPTVALVVKSLNNPFFIDMQIGAEEAAEKSGGSICLDMSKIAALPRGLSRRVVRDFISRWKGDLRGISFEDVEGVLSLSEGKKISLKEDNKIKYNHYGNNFYKECVQLIQTK